MHGVTLESTSWRRAFYTTLFFLFTAPLCRAVLVNRTIDSNLGDLITGFVPIYQPQSSWDDQTCSSDKCWIQPDTAKAFDGTWNAATYSPELQNVNVTLQFTGIAVWVFFILSNANSHGNTVTANTQVNITLDGRHAGSFSYDPDMTTQNLIYNTTIFSASGLANTPHELVIATNNYPNQTYINFDWAIYTTDQGGLLVADSSSATSTSSSTPSPPSPTIGIIVGCTLGGLAVIALVLLFLFHRLRRPSLVRYAKKSEGILDIDIPPRKPKYNNIEISRRGPSVPAPSEYTYFPPSPSSTQSPGPDHASEGDRVAMLREARQRDIDDRIRFAQRKMDTLTSARSPTRSPTSSSAASSSQPIVELALLRNEVQQLRNQIGYLQTRRESSSALDLSDEPLPPAYT